MVTGASTTRPGNRSIQTQGSRGPIRERTFRCRPAGDLMYGLPSNTDLSFLVGRQLAQLCLGQYQAQLRFDGDVTISLEGEFSLDGQRRPISEAHVLYVLLGLEI